MRHLRLWEREVRLETTLPDDNNIAADDLIAPQVQICLHPLGNIGIIGDGIGVPFDCLPGEIRKRQVLSLLQLCVGFPLIFQPLRKLEIQCFNGLLVYLPAESLQISDPLLRCCGGNDLRRLVAAEATGQHQRRADHQSQSQRQQYHAPP